MCDEVAVRVLYNLSCVSVCQIIGRVQADPDYLPRTEEFGLHVEAFQRKFCPEDCPPTMLKVAVSCTRMIPEDR